MVEATTLWTTLSQVNILKLQGTTALGLSIPVILTCYGIATLLAQNKSERDTLFVITLIMTIPFFAYTGIAMWLFTTLVMITTIITLSRKWKTKKQPQ